ncbi:MAG: hypothetical protein ACK52I_37315 [Pseudomonadota bacterium]
MSGTNPSAHKAHGNGLAAFPATKPAASGKQKALPAAADYAPGHFLKVMQAGFPPRWESRIERDSKELIAARLAAGRKSGWMAQGGTVLMPGTPKNDAPGWMK